MDPFQSPKERRHAPDPSHSFLSNLSKLQTYLGLSLSGSQETASQEKGQQELTPYGNFLSDEKIHHAIDDQVLREWWQKKRAAWRQELTADQQLTLRELETFGWSLAFIRHPIFQPSICVICDPSKENFSVLNTDGSINHHHGLSIRPMASSRPQPPQTQ